MNLDKGTTAEKRPVWRKSWVQACGVLLLGVLVVAAVARTAETTPSTAPAPAVTPTVTPTVTPPPADAPPEAWAVTIMFLDGIRTTNDSERARIMQETATEHYAGLVAGITDENLIRGTVQGIEPAGHGTFRVDLRKENAYQPGDWVTERWTISVTEDPFSPLQWRVSDVQKDGTP